MKEFLYILFCVVILGLGIILLNSTGGDELFQSEYPVYVSPGVDLSKMNNIRSTYVPAQRNQVGGGGLIGGNSSKKVLPKGNYSLLSPDAANSTTRGLATAPSTSGLSLIGKRTGEATSTGGGSPGSSVLLLRSSGGNSDAIDGQGSSPAVGSSVERGFRGIAVNPFSDYVEGDITHPGGNPTGDPLVNVPVGDGMLPLLLMGVAYLLFVLFKRIYK
ncbi:MAG: hypothetical protein PHQ11_12765 [Paludibacter sp.]|nr:hypothetical protein [Paludibacter sp.]MDD4199162.1 hypothetical protein [Paludibacter sp.]MDD4427794.1 hypothetical protein [Paludibacter sp.]